MPRISNLIYSSKWTSHFSSIIFGTSTWVTLFSLLFVMMNLLRMACLLILPLSFSCPVWLPIHLSPIWFLQLSSRPELSWGIHLLVCSHRPGLFFLVLFPRIILSLQTKKPWRLVSLLFILIIQISFGSQANNLRCSVDQKTFYWTITTRSPTYISMLNSLEDELAYSDVKWHYYEWAQPMHLPHSCDMQPHKFVCSST